MFDPVSTSPRDAWADQADRQPDGASTVPRGHDSHHDMSHDMSSVLERIEQRVEEIEAEIATLAPLVHERARLLRARATILGEPAPDLRRPASPRRITKTDVFEYLTRHPGSRAGEIALGLGVEQSAVSAHLYRGKGRVFSRRADRWYPVPAADPGLSST